MNRKQLMVLWVGAGLIALMVLFPPWKCVYYAPGRLRIEKPAPYGFVFSPPEIPVTSRSEYGEYFEGFSRNMWSLQIDYHRLVLPVCAVAVVTFALTLAFRR